ncbi:FAD-dependent monooxygenase [Crossiella sp. CA-258035]|uniref:FAD-dependent monooxygenase n=1 Tax=Crossiella sp. CA-258035 TaxID=2981138 RepID=UPI0024BC2F24|nr:FAD-dependent monooxygenase [Crossiella sp. CA-258035]WHT22597.1 FAD-dependent monooxygenase [Crossiella sp. CA-258035]
MSMVENPVIVVGAGPTGLTLACGLRAAGVPVRVLDAADGPATTSRALGLQPRGVEVLDRLGALADLPARALPVLNVDISVSGRMLAQLRVGQQTRLGGQPGLLMSQATIEEALRARLGQLGGIVEWGQEVTDLDQDPGGVAVRVGAEVLRAGWVAGCDGAHSRVRKAAGIDFPGVPLVERFLIADVRAPLKRPRDAAAVWFRGLDMLAAFPLPGADLWRLMTPAPADAAISPEELLRRRLARETGVAVRTVDWLSTFQIQRRLATTYRRGRVLLAGDAAHIHSPLGGQGMNTGMGDAENLAWKLAAVVLGRAGEPLLDTYLAERRPLAAEVLRNTTGATNVLFSSGHLARLLRELLVVPAMRLSLVQRRIAEGASQLTISYRGGPLAPAGPRRGGLRPGDRVPDLTCCRADGSTTRLHAELGGRWALLAPTAAPVTATRDWLGDLLTELTWDRHELALVRPDGHLAWRGTDTAGLTRWLAQTLSRPGPR